jgi:uncharacterized protein YlxP (DUF503 family)
MASDGFVAVLIVHLHFPEAQSLKAKRRELSRLKSGLQSRLSAAVAETGHHERWQRSTLTAALAARSAADATLLADSAERWLLAHCPEGVWVERLVASVDDLRGLPAGRVTEG